MEGKKCANSLLQCPAEAKTALKRIVQVINNGGAESVVGDITLRTTATRPADQSPYEVSSVASAEGQMFRREGASKPSPNLIRPVRTIATGLRSVGSFGPTDLVVGRW